MFYIIGSKGDLSRVNQRSRQIYNLTGKSLSMKGYTFLAKTKNAILKRQQNQVWFYGDTEKAKIEAQKNIKKNYIFILSDIPNKQNLDHLCKYGIVLHHHHLYIIGSEMGTVLDKNENKRYKKGETNIKVVPTSSQPQQPKKEDVSKSS